MTRKYDTSTLPIQKLPMSKKTKEWREACVDYYISKERSSSYFDSIKVAYDLYNGIYSEDDLQYVVNPFKVKEGFPASPHSFNIIKPKVDLILGELTKRPDPFKVFHTSEDAVSKIQEEYIQSLKDYIYNKIGEGFDNIEQDQKLQEIQEFFKGNSFVDEAEEAGYHTLNYLKEFLDLSNEQFKGFKDGLVAGIEVYYKGIRNGNPYAERVNPYYFTPDEDPDLQQVEKGQYEIYRCPMSITDIHQNLGDLMTETQFDELAREAYEGGSVLSNKASDVNYKPIWQNTPGWLSGKSETPEHMFNVWHVVWRSFKKIGFLTYTEEDGSTETILVDESYIPVEGETIEWEWWTEIWEGYKIENDLYIGIQPIEDQVFSIENPNGNDLPYIGSFYNNDNTTNKSLVEIMKPLQYMYIIVWYRLELALARDKGKAFVMDMTQIPKNSGLDMNTWLHYLNALGIIFVNPHEDGWDVPGREGRPASFNQFNAVDLSMSNVIAGYIELMAKIEDMIGEISGVSKQRQGAIQQRELVGNVERAVIQSSHITEHLFWTHNNIIKRLYNALLNTAKTAWSRSGKKKLYYIMDDSNRAFIDLSESFFYSDMGVFVSDSTRESLNIEKLATLLQPAMQNGATLLDAATILTSNNMSIIKGKLRDIESRRERMIQQQSESEQQVANMELQLKQDDNRIKEEDSIRRAETSIIVAQIQAASKAESVEPPEMEDNSLEEEKLNLNKEKLNKEYNLKLIQHKEETRKNKVAEEQRQQEIAIKKKQANKPVAKSK